MPNVVVLTPRKESIALLCPVTAGRANVGSALANAKPLTIKATDAAMRPLVLSDVMEGV
jgi:hypothetical protein